MNGVSAPPPLDLWSPRRWAWTIFGLLVAQTALIVFFSDRSLAPRIASVPPANMWLVLDAQAQARLSQDLAPLDPTLFALPHPQNFSGSAWLKSPRLTNEMQEWTDAGPLFAINAALFCTNLVFSSQSSPATYPLIASKPEPRSLETLVPEEPLSTGTLAYVEGDVKSRPITLMPAWPLWPMNELIGPPTVVQLWVDNEGFVRDAALCDGSGIPEADRYAVREARQIRFQSDASNDSSVLAWGKLVIHWGTLPLPATNQPRPAL